MARTVIEDFLRLEANEYVRKQLLEVISTLTIGERYFTYNVFNVRIDARSGTVTIEDELDVDRQEIMDLAAFERVLRKSEDSHFGQPE